MFNRLFSKSGLSLERLRTFCEVADAGSMAKAANGDTVRQSQFSRQMKDLEEHFGRKLTERRGRNVVLTKEGAEFAALARQVLGALEDFQVSGSAGAIELSLGAGESFHRGVILPRLGEIRERLPEVILGLRNMRSAQILDGLQDGRLDLGVLDEGDLTGELKCVRLGRVTYRLVVHKRGVSGAKNKTPDLKAVLAMPFVGMEGESKLMTAITDLGVRSGVQVNFAVKCSSWPAVADALMKCDGVGILPSVIPPPDQCIEIETPGLKAFDRVLALAWDARRGTLRSQSVKSQRVLGDVLKF
jgi:DNA-binding transcriptional LysR family regulator